MNTYGSVASGRRILDDELVEVGKGITPLDPAARATLRRSLTRAEPKGELSRRLKEMGAGPMGPSQAGLVRPTRPVSKGVQGVMAPLARKTPAAGRAGRRVITGDRENKYRVIGKSEEVAKFGIGSLKGVRSGLKTGWGAGRTGGSINTAGPLSHSFNRAQKFGQYAGRRPVATGAVAGAAGMATLTGGNGMNNRYKPQAPSFGYGGFGKMYSEQLQHPDGSWEIRSDEGHGFRSRKPFPTRTAKHVKRFSMKASVEKRSYDPEAERRFRQGTYAAGAGLGGAYALQSGVRQVRRDTKDLRSAANRLDNPRIPPEAKARTHNIINDPSGATYRSGPRRGQPKKVKVPVSDIDRVNDHGRVERNARERAHGLRQQDLLRDVRKPRGALVRRGAAAKIGGGVGGLGLAGALLSRRHEERWD